MRKELKYPIFLVISLVIVISVLSIWLWTSQPKASNVDEFSVTIKGNIIDLDSVTNGSSKPETVRVFPSVFTFNNLCRYNEFDVASNITWNGNQGTYVITLKLPVEQEVIITPKCGGCYPERIYLNRNKSVYSLDLKWDTSECIKNDEGYSDSKKALDRARDLLDGASAELNKYDFDKNTTADIKSTITRGQEHIEDAKTSSNESESLYHAEYAILYGWNTYNQIDLANANLCLNLIKSEIEKHNNSCYNIPYESQSSYTTINNTVYNLHTYFAHYEYDAFQMDKLNNEINYISNNERDTISMSKNNCFNTLKIIKESLKYQEPYCKKSKIATQSLYIIFVSLAFIIGLILGKIGRRWNE
jgi:hypothetical protein